MGTNSSNEHTDHFGKPRKVANITSKGDPELFALKESVTRAWSEYYTQNDISTTWEYNTRTREAANKRAKKARAKAAKLQAELVKLAYHRGYDISGYESWLDRA
jgi:hypothetical protein